LIADQRVGLIIRLLVRPSMRMWVRSGRRDSGAGTPLKMGRRGEWGLCAALFDHWDAAAEKLNCGAFSALPLRDSRAAIRLSAALGTRKEHPEMRQSR